MDVMHDFATPLTYTIIAGLMDIPPSDRAFVKELCGQMCGLRWQPAGPRSGCIAEGVQAVTDYLWLRLLPNGSATRAMTCCR